MKVLNKIKYEHLDQTLIDWLSRFMKKGTIAFNDLSVDLQEIIRGSGNGSNYNDVPIRKELNKKADKETLQEYFNKTSEKVDMNLLSSDLQNIINTVKTLNQALGSGVRLQDDFINIDDLDPSVRNKINTIDEQIARVRIIAEALDKITREMKTDTGDIDLGNIVNSIGELKDELKQAKTNVSDINAVLHGLDTRTDSNAKKINSLQEQLKTKANLIDGLLVEEQIPTTIAKKTDLNELSERINNLVLGGSETEILPVYFAETDDKAIEYRNQKKSIIVDLINNRMLFLAEKIRDADTWDVISKYSAMAQIINKVGIGEYQKDEKVRYVYDVINFLSGNKYLINKQYFDVENQEYLYNEAGSFISISSGLVKYKANENTDDDEDNDYTSTDLGNSPLEYFAGLVRDAVKEGDVSENKVTIKNASIQYKDKTELSIRKPHVRNIKVLVKDTIKNSRSFNKWINGEGMVTISYDIENDKVIFYNDAQNNIEILIIYNKE